MRAFLALPRKYKDLNRTRPLGTPREYEMAMVPKIMVIPGLRPEAFYEARPALQASLAKSSPLPEAFCPAGSYLGMAEVFMPEFS